ncbi:hypothetical protein AAFF_G00048790 [Aldrovandia affinis]|uniref:Uncharacterized protein n=1 Tax=Aldrovandia affinis TaxID=143900 RepID=A0AAD7VY80_9TELE|nr:hypothetical protein AAFF_G00048790 [Aldrovandia affinis]
MAHHSPGQTRGFQRVSIFKLLSSPHLGVSRQCVKRKLHGPRLSVGGSALEYYGPTREHQVQLPVLPGLCVLICSAIYLKARFTATLSLSKARPAPAPALGRGAACSRTGRDEVVAGADNLTEACRRPPTSCSRRASLHHQPEPRGRGYPLAFIVTIHKSWRCSGSSGPSRPSNRLLRHVERSRPPVQEARRGGWPAASTSSWPRPARGVTSPGFSRLKTTSMHEGPGGVAGALEGSSTSVDKTSPSKTNLELVRYIPRAPSGGTGTWRGHQAAAHHEPPHTEAAHRGQGPARGPQGPGSERAAATCSDLPE